MTPVQTARDATGQVRRARSRLSVREALSSGWPPAGSVLALTVAVLHHYGVDHRQTAVFGVFSVLAVTLPGTLLVRALRGGARHLAEDAAAGTALGHAITVLGYLPERWAGLPLLVPAWPIATIIAFVAIPALRPYWRGAGRAGRVPAAFSWGLAAFVALAVMASGTSFFRDHRLAWPGYAAPYIDMPFHLGLLGELKHHVPPASPFVLGEPLHYHWFVYADMAATSWATGIEPEVLLYRLYLLPVLAASIVLTAMIARRLTGGWWPGLAALGLAVFARCPSPCPWAPGLGADIVLRDEVPWWSPTQAFGAMLFAALVLLLIDLLRRPRAARGPWVLFAVLLAATLGSKSVFLPILLSGLLCVLAVTALVRRRLHRTAAVAAVMVTTAVLFAQIAIFGGTSDGLVVHPLSIFGTVAADVGATTGPSFSLKLAVVLICVFGLGCVWVGLIMLAFRPAAVLDAPVLLLLGVGVSGAAAGLILRFPGSSQRQFLYGAAPYLCLVAVHGLVAVLPPREDARFRRALLAAMGGGVALILTIRWLNDGPRPAAGVTVQRVVGPFLVLVCAVAVLLAALAVAGRRRLALRPASPAIAAAFVMGLVLPTTAAHVRDAWRGVVQTSPTTVITPGTIAAGRWLRDHSRPGDVVATNSICTTSHPGRCDAQHFSVAAYTERRVLVEGWSYEARTPEEAAKTHVEDAAVPFWDRGRLADNDAAFHRPSPVTVRWLRDRYGVRWLFVDRRHDGPAPALAHLARLRFTAGDWSVYEI
ncbi:hypothetical protein [Actinoallomurus rhizosphaericola]|uniref:hypothetical protein n=1 Tax=Actinoallomurus rhizosphaericola TaxID=2952536 RepID=UPI002092882F|nr:hypothetical protein [Actinoallomurus rhizosphaericola]MCO5998411.1 hypothetical protein [Actinoallomurus rhizosphaericola]